MTAKHTPGPWVAEDRTERMAIFGNVGNADGESGGAYEVASIDLESAERPQAVEANAALIAAAPELADALRWTMECLDKRTAVSPEVRQAALEKAALALRKAGVE